ncbi:MAG: DinB family protein [Spirosomaceae bacterium]|nr:DinB family protein [Spirosomataceae bacterium]
MKDYLLLNDNRGASLEGSPSIQIKKLKESLIKLFGRDLDSLRAEIEAYTDESLLWKRAEGINNPSGNLVLHLVGNLNNYIGAILGNSGYIRNRPAEFSSTTTKEDLLQKIQDTKKVVIRVIENLSAEDFQEEYPEDVLSYPMTTEYFLIHLQGHLNYHLGQINYHRRLLSNSERFTQT